MLAVQLGLNKSCKYPTFRANEDIIDTTPSLDEVVDETDGLEKQPEDDVVDFASANEDNYKKETSFWQNQKKSFDDIVNDKSMPKVVRNGMKLGSILASAILGGWALAFGTKKSINALESLSKKESVAKFNNKVKTGYKSFKTALSNAYKTFKDSDFVKSYKKFMADKKEKFNNSKFGKNSFVQSFLKGCTKVNKAIKNGFKYVINKIKSIKGEDAKKVTVNTLGISGGVSTGVATLRETQAKEKREN